MDASADTICSICGEIFDDVWETPCSHTFCKACLVAWIAKSKTCPLKCRQGMVIEISHCRPNVPLQRLINNLPAPCDYQVAGCTATVTRGNLDAHVQNCGYCPLECEFGKAKCLNIMKNNIKEHREQCPFKPMKCDYCFQTIEWSKVHGHPLVCPSRIVACAYSKYGCDVKMKQSDVQQHMKTHERTHFLFMESALKDLEQENKEMKSALTGFSQIKPDLLYAPLNSSSCLLPSKLVGVEKYATAPMSSPIETLRAKFWGVAEQIDPRLAFGNAYIFVGSSPIIFPSDYYVPDVKTNIPSYFEITVSNNGPNDHVSIGFITPGLALNQRLGGGGLIHDAWSWGFHIFENVVSFSPGNEKKKLPYSKYAPNLAKNVIGCLLIKGNVSFTINGQLEPVAFAHLPYEKKLFPAIGVESQNVTISANFGQEPFLYKDLPSKEILRCLNENKCTWSPKLGSVYQPTFHCFSCEYEGKLILCSTCIETCHKGHHIVPTSLVIQKGYCHCGCPTKHGNVPVHCKSKK